MLSDILNSIKGICFLPNWWMQKLRKRDNRLWTFGAWDGLRYSDNSRAIYEYTLTHHPEIQCVWMTKSEEVYQKLKEKHLPVALCGTKKARAIQAKSGVFFASKGALDSEPMYMGGIRYINLWHGMPLKKIGNDAMLFVRKDTFFKKIKTAYRRFTMPWEFIEGVTLSSAPFFSPFLQSAFGLSESEVWLTGMPRLDKLLSTERESLIDDIDQRFNHPTKVLYMPTHRDKEHGHFNPFHAAGFHVDTLNKVLEEKNIVLLYKGHFFDSQMTDDKTSQRIMTISDEDYDDLYTFVKDCDILLTDYSSIYFDFLLTRKPMILFPFDEKEYVEESRPFYFDYSLMAAQRVYTWDELAKCLEDETYYVPSDEEIQRFCPLQAPGCCEAIAKKVIALINS